MRNVPAAIYLMMMCDAVTAHPNLRLTNRRRSLGLPPLKSPQPKRPTAQLASRSRFQSSEWK